MLRGDRPASVKARLAQRRGRPGTGPRARRSAGPARRRRPPRARPAARASTGGSGAGPSASSQAASAGRISVAIWPGGAIAAATAAAPSRRDRAAVGEVRTQSDNGRATPSMSEVSGASYCSVVGRVVADDVDHRRVGAPRVVHVGEAVGEAGAQVQQGRRPACPAMRA